MELHRERFLTGHLAERADRRFDVGVPGPLRDMPAVGAALAELVLPSSLAPALLDFARLFHRWNQRINLSAARSEADIADHIVDCLHLIPPLRSALEAWPAPTVLDVGSGGGLPAVIIAICIPDAGVTALEPVHKKHAFLRTAARELSLANLDPRAERSESHAVRGYAAATSRATLDLRDWLTLGLRFVAAGGAVFGFEALRRDDLPPATARHRYAHLGKSRAIVSLHRPAAS